MCTITNFIFQLELEVCDDDSEPYIDIAKRPPWHYNCSTAELQKTETRYFQVIHDIFR